MMLYRLRCMRLALPTALSFAGGPEAGVWEGQRCGYRGRSLRSEDNRTAEAALPLEQGSGRLAGRGACGRFSAGRLRASACGVGMCGGAGGWCRKADGMERVRVAAF